MSISSLRRNINDSKLGHKINDSMPGILIEGAVRGVYEVGNKLINYSISGIAFGGALLVSKKRPLSSITLAIVGVANLELSKMELENRDIKTHYSHTSRLYQRSNPDGIEVMERVSLKQALVEKIKSYLN